MRLARLCLQKNITTILESSARVLALFVTRSLVAHALVLFSSDAWAACPVSPSADAQLPVKNSEIALSNMVLYSQEYMRYFFSDNDSDIQPLPASGLSLFLGRDISPTMRVATILTLPLREEEVRRKDREPFRYFYPKVAMLGLEKDVYTRNLLARESCFRLSASAGLTLPLSRRLLSSQPPYVLLRASTEISSDVFLNFGIGYSGIISAGAWFFPFGVSYLIKNKKEDR